MADSATTIVGNMTRDAELRYTTGGRGVASFGVAVSHRYQRNGEWTEDTSFFNVTAWGDLGENCAASLVKGNRVIVTGRLSQRTYEDRDNNSKSVVEIVADSIGPDLRWATAVVERTERTSSGGTTGAKAPVYGDEEPFVRPASESDL